VLNRVESSSGSYYGYGYGYRYYTPGTDRPAVGSNRPTNATEGQGNEKALPETGERPSGREGDEK
jgi:hypothetical protein